MFSFPDELTDQEFSQIQIINCSLSIVYRFCLVMLLSFLFNFGFYKSLLFISIINFCFILISLLKIDDSVKSKTFKKVFLEQCFGWIYKSEINYLEVQMKEYILYAKIISYKLESFFLLWIIISYEEIHYYPFLYLAQISGSILSCFTYTIAIKLDKQRYILKIMKQFAMENLFQSYLILCHQSSIFIFYDLCILQISFAIQNISYIQNSTILKFGYKYDTPNVYLKEIIPSALIYQLFGFHYDFIEEQQELDKQSENENFINCLQLIQLTFMIIFDKLMNEQKNSHIMKIQIAYLVYLSYYFVRVIFWFIKYIKYGPYNRVIQINCRDLKSLTTENIIYQYFRINNLTIDVQIIFQNFDPIQFERISKYILLSKTYRSKTLTIQEEQQQKLDFYYVYEQEKYIWLKLQCIKLSETLIRTIVENNQFEYKYTILNLQNNDRIDNIIIKYYQIIPNIEIKPSRLNNKILFVISEIRRLIVYNKRIKHLLNFQPNQIFYDLHDY